MSIPRRWIPMPSPQGRYFIATLSCKECTDKADEWGSQWTPSDLFYNYDEVVWVMGQKEIGAGGFWHYQFVFAVDKKMTIVKAKKLFCKVNPHLELTKSDAADKYVRKEDTKVPGSEFEYGAKQVNLNISDL